MVAQRNNKESRWAYLSLAWMPLILADHCLNNRYKSPKFWPSRSLPVRKLTRSIGKTKESKISATSCFTIPFLIGIFLANAHLATLTLIAACANNYSVYLKKPDVAYFRMAIADDVTVSNDGRFPTSFSSQLKIMQFATRNCTKLPASYPTTS